MGKKIMKLKKKKEGDKIHSFSPLKNYLLPQRHRLTIF